jgi:hypothetical protein
VERKIRFSVKNRNFLQLPVVGCISKIKQRGSAQYKRGVSLNKTNFYVEILGTTWSNRDGHLLQPNKENETSVVSEDNVRKPNHMN